MSAQASTGAGVHEAEEAESSDKLTPDKSFQRPKFGLLPEHPLEASHTTDVIVIHGVCLTSWVSDFQNGSWEPLEGPKASTSWVNQLFKDSRLLHYHYDIRGADDTNADVLNRGGVEREAQKLLDALLKTRAEREKKGPIVFVSHDIGGIILKKALALSALDLQKYEDIFSNTTVLVFLGCPHRGDAAVLEEFIDELLHLPQCSLNGHRVETVSNLSLTAREVNAEFLDTKLFFRTSVFNIHGKTLSDTQPKTPSGIIFNAEGPYEFSIEAPGHHVNLGQGEESVPLEAMKKYIEDRTNDTYAARPIHIALDWGMLQATEALLEAGAEADPQEVGPEPKVTAWTVRTLAEAASNGLDGCVRILLDKGADIKGTLNSRSALWYAALRGRLDVCRRLLEKGADPNECPEDYGPLLIKVVELDEDTEKILSLLRLLVDAGADVNVVDPSPNWRRNALTRAATLNKKEVVEFLLDKGANPDLGAFADCGVLTELGTDAVQTALYGAAWNGHIDIAKLLIDRGSNIHLQSQKKWTAFLAAYDNAELVKLLLEKGADINSVCSSGTIVHLASRNSHVKTLKVLLEHNPKPDLETEQPDGLTALCVACQEGEVEIAKLLLVAGANKNHQTSGGDYPLKLCVVAGFDRVVRTLLSFQPDLTICDQGGNTILHQILNHGPSVSIFEMLLMAGANINAQNKDGETPLIVAAKVRNDDLFTFLLDRGADASITRPGQDSLLHVAASSGAWETFKAVVDAGLTVPLATAEQAPGTLLYNAASSYKFEGKMKILEYLVGEAKLPVNENCTGKLWQYALHAAAVAEDDAAVRYLVEKGADVRAVDTTGRTALHLAAYKCNGIAVDVLLRHGADPLARTKMGMLPIHFAAAHLTNSEGVDRLIREFAGLPVDSEDPQVHPSDQRETAAGKSAPKEGDKSRVKAHVNDRDGDGWTPLMWAAKNNYNNTHVLRSLLDHGADVWYKEESSDRRWTPLKISRYYGAMPEIYELLEPEDKTRTRTDGSLEKWKDEIHQTREADYKTGYWCNHCCTLICGKRWHCLDCSHSFDLCYKCSANKDVLHGGASSGHNFEAVEPEYTDPEPVSEQGRNTENGEEADEIKDGEDDPVKGGRETNEGEDIADMINLDDENNTDSDED
ncbi:Ankyrin-3 [Colletotrichum trifolii]|uniref:Ankyrin-3 n=1 Tax=Colletotrichum trifolii TaxID=5466 RepID=A0A4R8RJD6_COLTR|nr:Ankyrin-3 [Colletotrichum trifolii]